MLAEAPAGLDAEQWISFSLNTKFVGPFERIFISLKVENKAPDLQKCFPLANKCSNLPLQNLYFFDELESNQ